MNTSILTKRQVRTYGPKPIVGYGPGAQITAEVRFDDQCGNGYNTFAITAEVVTPASKRQNDIAAGGCLHEDVARIFPELAPLIKWHLCSSDGPMHYEANSLYWAGQTKWEADNLVNFRSTAVWIDATQHDMQTITPEILRARLPALMAEFRAAVESLGFVW